jgi:hypothetical protein
VLRNSELAILPDLAAAVTFSPFSPLNPPRHSFALSVSLTHPTVAMENVKEFAEYAVAPAAAAVEHPTNSCAACPPSFSGKAPSS